MSIAGLLELVADLPASQMVSLPWHSQTGNPHYLQCTEYAVMCHMECLERSKQAMLRHSQLFRATNFVNTAALVTAR